MRVEVASEQRESAETSRPVNMAVVGSLHTSVHHAPMERARLVEVVGRVHPWGCIVEEEHSTDEKGGLMPHGAERSEERGDSLPVVHEAVGEEERRQGSESLSDVYVLTHVATIDLGSIDDGCSLCHDAVLDDDVASDEG